ncbi:hypothetical protein pipiens_018323, partial [Culex pipiens pipiens]
AFAILGRSPHHNTTSRARTEGNDVFNPLIVRELARWAMDSRFTWYSQRFGMTAGISW